MSRTVDDLTPLRTLFQIGVLGGLADGRLLEIFTTERDAAARETAFAVLVERHGPVVLKVCRDVLGNEHAAEDAFQATFLVLARRARSIRKADSLASWLFGVARRVALKARADESRRRANELRGVKMGAKGSDAQPEAECWPELYEELDRLPQRYREPLVLCYLAGLTYEQAAGALKCPVRTVQTRLIRGRERLRGRLVRRGLGPPAGLLGAAVLTESARASVPAALAQITARSAVSFTAGHASGVVSASVVSLAEGVLRTMLLNKIKLVTAATTLVVAGTSAVFLASGILQAQVAPRRAAPPKGASAPRDDLAVLQGSWSATLAAPNGENMTVVWTIERDSLAMGFLRPDSKTPVVVKGRIEIDSRTSPKSFAIVNATGPDGNPQKDNLGIYEIEGDTLKVCYGTPGNPRPKAFEAGEFGPPMVMTLKRGGTELKAQPPAAVALPTEPVEVSGRVQAPDGRPYSGAKIYFFRPDDALAAEEPRVVDPKERAVRATSGPDGTFKFRAMAGDFAGVVRASPTSQPTISAVAEGYGPGWVCCASPGDATDAILRLVKDDVPISGRVLNLEGRAVAGATVHVMGVYALQAENPAAIVKIFQRSPAPAEVFQCLEKRLDQSASGLPESVRAGKDGRFRITGAGRGRVVELRIEGPGIATQKSVNVLTNGAPLPNAREAIKKTDPEVTFSVNPAFEIFADPTQAIAGVVRDKESGKPIAGVIVKSNSLANVPLMWNDFVRTTTDAQGRYRLLGLPKGPGHTIMAVPPDGDPHVASLAEAGGAPFSEPVKIDFNLKRGVLIKGRVTALGSGLPVRGRVEYFAAWSNQNVNDFPGFLGTRRSVPTRADGSYAVAGVPGEGMVGVRAQGEGFPTVNKLRTPKSKEVIIPAWPYHVEPSRFHAIVGFTAPSGATEFEQNVVLDQAGAGLAGGAKGGSGGR